jgi:hypothetical protein
MAARWLDAKIFPSGEDLRSRRSNIPASGTASAAAKLPEAAPALS